jgi:hypothetical protein
VPTKRRRHAITETPPVEEALNDLRGELNGERVDLGELVILGAREKLARLRAKELRNAELRRELANAIRNRELTPIDPEVAAEARRGRVFE